MKTTETKTNSFPYSSHTSRSFFQKNGEGTFFSDPKTNDQNNPFFSQLATTPFVQPKLTIGRPGDKYEQEADAVAQKVVSTSAPAIQTRCSDCVEKEKLQKQYQPRKEEEMLQTRAMEEEEDLQMKPSLRLKDNGNSVGRTEADPKIQNKINSSRGSGRSLDSPTRRFMGNRMQTDFSRVTIHTGWEAVHMNRELRARAFTVGSDIYFNEGEYRPETTEGKKLLAHELTHVIQQDTVASVIRRDDIKPAAPTPPKLKYKYAEKENKKYAQPDSLGWEGKLATVAGGKYKAWLDLWKAGKFDEFADAVAEYQMEQGFKRKSIDGILGLGTWAKVGGYGEAIAGITDVQWPKSEYICTIAARERIERGHKLATGRKFQLAKDKSEKTFNIILQSIEPRMADVDEVYRGSGAPGAMVYAGFATFVSEADIWKGGLKPGAPMQVWGLRDSYNLLRKGEIEYKRKGVTRTRRLRSDDANFYGTSFVFVRYDDPTKPTKMLVRHFGRPEWHSKSEFQVWIGANIN